MGSYTYAGTGYANPHAATQVGTSTYSYDNSGNLTSGNGLTNTWDYKNQLTQTFKAGTTYRYLYDHTGQRTSYFDGSATTTFPSKYYEVTGTRTTKHIYAGDTLIASIENNGTPTTYIVHTDHLGGTNVVTDSSGNLNQTLSYYPFGSTRINQQQGSFNERNKFTGHDFDDQTGLYYMQARYENPSIGRFISEDPSFLDIGRPDFKQLYGQPLALFLATPQNLNSYSYVNNNPVTLKDPDGRIIPLLIALGITYAPEIALGLTALTTDVVLSSMAADSLATLGDRNASLGEKAWAGAAFAPFGVVAREAKTAANSSQIVKFGLEYARNSSFKFTARAWSQGEVGDSVGSLVDHYVRHGGEFGARSAREYYQMANDFVDSGNYVTLAAGNGKELWNAKTNTLGVLGPRGELRTFYRPDAAKANSLNQKARQQLRK